MKKVLVIIDMQNDFIDGPLGNDECKQAVPAVIDAVNNGGYTDVILTRDTHGDNYLNTQEGRKLPVPHCMKGTEGWKIIPELQSEIQGAAVLEKPSFGSGELARLAEENGYDRIQLTGVCTDICVISNALLLKTALPEAEISVDASCCAGVTPESHKNALEAMKMCQIQIENA